MIPLRDENPTELTPFVTFSIIAANVLVWIFVENMGAGQVYLDSLCEYGAIPAEVTGRVQTGEVIRLGDAGGCTVGGPSHATLITSMFMHGGWMHLIGNMWFLWVFGNNIEDSTGHLRFVLFYLLTGVLAALAHIVLAPGSTMPTVGASGAISGVMGAYIVLYPRVRVHTAIPFGFYIRVIPMSAWVVLALWFGLQLLGGWLSSNVGGGIAYGAHIGGFVAGVSLIKLFERRGLVAAKLEHRVLTREERRDFGLWS